jgi:hypothetical protein
MFILIVLATDVNATLGKNTEKLSNLFDIVSETERSEIIAV